VSLSFVVGLLCSGHLATRERTLSSRGRARRPCTPALCALHGAPTWAAPDCTHNNPLLTTRQQGPIPTLRSRNCENHQRATSAGATPNAGPWALGSPARPFCGSPPTVPRRPNSSGPRSRDLRGRPLRRFATRSGHRLAAGARSGRQRHRGCRVSTVEGGVRPAPLNLGSEERRLPLSRDGRSPSRGAGSPPGASCRSRPATIAEVAARARAAACRGCELQDIARLRTTTLSAEAAVSTFSTKSRAARFARRRRRLRTLASLASSPAAAERRCAGIRGRASTTSARRSRSARSPRPPRSLLGARSRRRHVDARPSALVAGRSRESGERQLRALRGDRRVQDVRTGPVGHREWRCRRCGTAGYGRGSVMPCRDETP
jgi:hypothetical protein